MDPRGSSTRKKNRPIMKRWEMVAQALYEISTVKEFPETTPWKQLNKDDQEQYYALASAAIDLVDNLIVPALKKGNK